MVLMAWDVRLAWTLLILAALLLGWAVWRGRAAPPAAAPGTVADPFAAEVAEFNRSVSDWRG
jgi:hypothetical protein